MRLTGAERRTLALLADTFVPRTDQPGIECSASDLGVDALMARAIEEYLPPDVRDQFRRLLGVVESRALNLLLTGRATRFMDLRPAEREAYLLAWARSRLLPKRQVFHSVKRLTEFLYYSALPDGRENPTWGAIGYDAPDDAARAHHRTPPDVRIAPMDVEAGATVDTDLAVLGSGAGGSVIAAAAAEAGFRVLVVEAGPLRTPETFTGRELPSTEGMLERHGLLTTRDFAFGVLHGRTAGGGTTVNWMTCLRPPPRILEEWEREHGIPGLTGPEFRAHLDAIEERLGVTTSESTLTPSSEALRRGCEALGYREGVDYHVTPKNARGCGDRCDYCFFGCVYSAKQSTLVTYLPDAARHGARFLFDTEAKTIEISPGGFRVHAVRKRDGEEVPLEVRARIVVAAAGAVQTPALLLRSGFRHRGIGRGLRLHPTTGVGGVFDRDIRLWAGVPQTLHVDRWLWTDAGRWGFWLETVPAHPGLAGLGLPWRGGRAHKDRMLRYRRIAATVVLVRDRSSGRVSIDAKGNPVLDYSLTAGDRRNLSNGIVEAARIQAAAGARQIVTLHNEEAETPLREGPVSAADVDALAARVRKLGIRPNGIALFSAHAMGSVPMGSSDRAPTLPTGELRGVPNLVLGDGSVLPSAPAVNPMISIMGMARRTARFIVDALRKFPKSG